MGKIKILPEEVILKIAAGEVIERPASVVKELIENSIDAKAKNISIEIKDDLIKIVDDGTGMSKDDLKISCIRHATSKLETSDDLFNIFSLGFRGEALASIAGVSLLEITSKQEKEDANKIIIEGGNEISLSPSPFPFKSGTKIEVKNLFFNTPARKKFMKSNSTELRIISELVSNYALRNIGIGFKLKSNSKELINIPNTANLEERFYHVYPNYSKEVIDISNVSEIADLKFELKEKGIEIKGLISKPKIFKKNRSDEIIFVNGRLIKDSIIFSAISSAYKGFLNTNEFPICFLDISLNPKEIDVNVHPTKQEIKFENTQMIFSSVYHIIRESLINSDLTVNAGLDNIKNLKEENKDLSLFTISDSNNDCNNLIEKDTNDKNKTEESKETNESIKSEKELNIEEHKREVNYNNVREEQLLIKDEDIKSEKELNIEVKTKANKNIRLIGIFNKEFILAEDLDNQKLILVDFHAAAEIKNYELLNMQLKDKKIETQKLIQAEIIDLNLNQISLIREFNTLLNNLGFDLDEFGDNSIIIRSIPVVMGRKLNSKDFMQILDELQTNNKSDLIEKLKDKIITKMACVASEKAGDNLNLIEAEKILNEMFALDGNSYNCPHGRPTILEIDKEDIEKMFKRIR